MVIRPASMSPVTLLKIREGLKLTQVEFAKALRIGRSTYARWETGQTPIDFMRAALVRETAAKWRRAQGHAATTPDAA